MPHITASISPCSADSQFCRPPEPGKKLPPGCCPPPKTKWSLWKSKGGLCYYSEADKPPNNPSDTKLGTDDAHSEKLKQIWLDACVNQKKTDPDEGRQRPPLFTPDWTRIDACDAINEILKAVQLHGNELASYIIGLTTRKGELKNEMFPEDQSWFGETFTKGPVAIAAILVNVIQRIAKDLKPGAQCDGDAWTVTGIQRIIGDALSFLGGGAVCDWTRGWHYSGRFYCPTELPTAEQAIDLHLRGQLGIGDTECISRANNKIWPWWQKHIEAGRSRFTPPEYTQLFRRKLLTEDGLKSSLRELGYIRDNDWAKALELSRHIPGPSDLIRMMVRDVADQNIVDTFKLDTFFDIKWAGKLKEYGDAQGIDEDTAKYYWRAHWQIPAPTQLFYFWQRLRHDWIVGDAHVTDTQIKAALIQQDIPPFWVDKFLAVAHPPLRLVDIRRSYETGVIDRQQVYRHFLDRGNNDANAEVLTKYTHQAALNRVRRMPVVKMYANGFMNSSELAEALKDDGVREEIIPFAITAGRKLALIHRREACVKNIKRSFMTGVGDQDTVFKLLLDQGLDLDQSATLTSSWVCERGAKDKKPAISLLCRWFSEGVITQEELYSRIIGLGYGAIDAARIVENCLKDTEEALKKSIEKEAEDARKAEEKLERERKKQAKAASGEEDKRIASAKKAGALVQRRELAYTNAVSKASNRLGVPFSELKSELDAAGRSFQTQLNTTRHVTASAFPLAASDKSWSSIDELNRVWQEKIQSHIDAVACGESPESCV